MPGRVLVTRPEPEATHTARLLEERGYVPVVLPLTEIAAAPLADLPDVSRFNALAVTSANAVRQAPEDLLEKVKALPGFAVGEHTAAAMQAAGLSIAFAGAGDAAALAETIAARTGAGGHVLYPCGRHRAPEFEDRLRHARLNVTPLITYEARSLAYDPDALSRRLGAEAFAAVLVYSGRAAKLLSGLAGRAEVERVLGAARIVCISEAVAARLDGALRPRAACAGSPSQEALLAALDECLSQ